MGLNHLMHPRNIYKNKPPDFKILAQKYEGFRRFLTFASNGQVHLDFHNPDAVRCLTETLLKEDFNLNVILPRDALVPRIPQRLNYILLIEDLLISSGLNDDVMGIDIGTGPSCIFPLLGADHCGWKFLATEINDESMSIAKKNVKNNRLEEKITIIRGHDSSIFREALGTHHGVTFAFSMCNPPFFDKEECEARFSVSEEGEFFNLPGRPEDFRRPGPMSATVAKSTELWVCGGEVAFVGRMIYESQVFKTRIKLFTSLIGKKKSIAPLKRLLDDMQFVFYASHPISQGKTQRWVLVWSFDPTVKVHTTVCKRMLQTPPTEANPFQYFLKFCGFAGIVTEKHVSGVLMCFITSQALGFKPWKHSKNDFVDSEPPAKKSRSRFADSGTQTEFNQDLDSGNLCPAGDVDLVERNSQNEVLVQCCFIPQKMMSSKNYRVIISLNQESLEAEYLQSDDLGFRWMESSLNFYREKYRV